MIKGIKGGLSHAKKDKIKIQYEIEFKQLNNLSNDLLDQFVSLKWERGKYKGETSTLRVQKRNTTISPDNNMINPPNSVTSSDTTPIYNSEIINNILNNKELSKVSSTSSLTKKQSKLLIGNKIDGSNNMIGGDGFIGICNEKIQMKITLFSDTTQNKHDYTLQTNYEQKLLTIHLVNKSHNTLVTANLDLSNYMDFWKSTLISIPFPSSTPNQASLQISIKSKFLKYNDKKIHIITRDSITKKDILGNIELSNAGNKLIEVNGSVYYVINQIQNSTNTTNSLLSNNHDVSFTDPLHSESNTYSIITDDDDDDDVPTEDPFIVSPRKDNSNVIQIENQNLHCQIKDLHTKLTMLDNDYKDSIRMNEFHLKEIETFKRIIDESRIKVLEYEEHSHRSERLQKFIRNQLILERFEFKKIIETKESSRDSTSYQVSQVQSKNVKLIKDNNDLTHNIEELNHTILAKDEQISRLDDEISLLKRNNLELNASLEIQKSNYKKVLCDLTEFEFKYEKDRKISSANSSPINSPNISNRVLSPVLIQRKKPFTSIDNEIISKENQLLPILTQDEKNVNNVNNNQISKGSIFLNIIKSIVQTQYPSILHNPIVGWLVALFFLFLYIYGTSC